VPLAIPYGVYDLGTDAGWANVGVDHDTSAFAVASIRHWWAARGALDHPDADRLLITADAGGSNSYRYRLWKAELAALAAETGLTITVCHFPPGTSKWNKIEHRLFSQITMNGRGRPLTSHQVVVATIASTRTRTGLRVAAALDTGSYPLGVAVPAGELRRLPITAHARHGAWNYTIAPTGAAECGPVGAEERARARALAVLAEERLTGMSAAELAELAALLAPAQAAQAAQRRFEQRGGPRRRAAGAGSTGLLTESDRVLVTAVYQRHLCSMNVLSDLLGVNANSIGQAIADTRVLLAEHGRTIAASTLRFATAAAIIEFVSGGRREPARPRLAERLADPALTGMTRADLAALTERIVPVLTARAERHRHRQRGGERLPGARGGIFMQRSPTPTGCWPPCSTCAAWAPTTPSPSCSKSAAAPSEGCCARSASSWASTATSPHLPPLGSPPPARSSPRCQLPVPPATTRQQVDSLQAQWVRQRCQLAPSRTAPMACLRPVCASEMTSWTPPRPRAFSERRNAVQKAPSSESPTAKPSTSRCPSAATPVAMTTAWQTTQRSTRALQ
jgi:hypothetical protein